MTEPLFVLANKDVLLGEGQCVGMTYPCLLDNNPPTTFWTVQIKCRCGWYECDKLKSRASARSHGSKVAKTLGWGKVLWENELGVR